MGCSVCIIGIGVVDLDLFRGCVSTVNHVSYDSDQLPVMKKLKAQLKKCKRIIKEQSLFCIIGWQHALMVHKAVKHAVAKTEGWDKLTTGALQKDMNSFTHWKPLHGTVKVTYTDKIPSSPWMCLFRIEGKKLINIKGPGEFVKGPDLRPKKFR